MRMRFMARLPILSCLLSLLSWTAGACPMCKDAYSDGTGTAVATSFNPSILFMIGVTFTVVAGVAFRIWWAAHRRTVARGAGLP
jgi:hypothetical protein